jgi:two-component system, OmpR family, response regulator VicR
MSKILIVEDHAALRRGYRTILAAAGHEVFEAVDGEEALRQAEQVNPELILLDLLMPNMDGIRFLREYNVKEKHPNVIVIIFSNSSAPDKVQEAMDLGAKRYLIKAVISPKEIVKIVHAELGVTAG